MGSNYGKYHDFLADELTALGRRPDPDNYADVHDFYADWGWVKELVKGEAFPRTWPTRRELIGEVFDYIETFYNPTRRQSTLGYLSPAQFELRASR